jgi:hypothetical protein
MVKEKEHPKNPETSPRDISISFSSSSSSFAGLVEGLKW